MEPDRAGGGSFRRPFTVLAGARPYDFSASRVGASIVLVIISKARRCLLVDLCGYFFVLVILALV